jgi:hypothetical protein
LTTSGSSGKPRYSWNLGPASAYSAFERFWGHSPAKNVVQQHRNTCNTLEMSLRRQVLGQQATVLGDAAMLIELGIAAVSCVGADYSKVQAIIDEPLIVEAARNFLDATIGVKHLFSSDQGNASNLGSHFELLLVPAILENYHAVCQYQLGAAYRHEFKVPVKSAYGVLAVKCSTVGATLAWMNDAMASAEFEGLVPPCCLPDEHFGPDLVFLTWNETRTDFKFVLVQAKFKNKIANQQDALRTVDPKLLYHQDRGKPSPKLSRMVQQGDLLQQWHDVRARMLDVKADGTHEKAVVRMLVQFPAPKTRTVQPGVIEGSQDQLVLVHGADRDSCVKLFGQTTVAFLEQIKAL